MFKEMIPMKLNFFSEDSAGAADGAAQEGQAASAGGDGKTAGADPAGKTGDGTKEQETAIPAANITKEQLDNVIKIAESLGYKLPAQTAETPPQKKDGGEQDADAGLKSREAKVLAGELRIKAHVVLAEKGLDPALLDALIYTDEESCNKSIAALETAVKAAVEKALAEKDRIRGAVPKSPTGTPTAGGGLKQAIEAHIKKSGIV